MRNLREIEEQEARDRMAMMIILPVALLVFLYTLIGAALVVTQRGFSPCPPHASTIHNPNWLGSNWIAEYVLPIFAWGPRFVDHVVADDMPLRHFVFASDCRWSDQGPGRQRLFDRPGGPGSCPTGTVEFRGARCAIPVGDWEPVKRYSPLAFRSRCAHGWITFPERPVSCVLPALAKRPGQPCPEGFVAWSPRSDSDLFRMFRNEPSPLGRGWTPYPEGQEVCRRADVED